jgi:hypothetical protein
VILYIQACPPHPYFAVSLVLEESNAWPPVVFRGELGVHDDLVGKRICIGRGDGGNVVLVAIDNGDDFVGGLFQGLSHSASYF